MALETTGTSANATAAPATPRMQMNQSAQPQQPQRWSFHSGSPFQRGPIGRNISSEALGKLQKAMEEVYKTASAAYEVQLVCLDNNNQSNLAYSVLVLCLKSKAEPDLGVSYYPMIVEGSGEKIPPRFENLNGNQYEIVRVAGEAMDAVLASEIHKKLVVLYPNQKLLPSDGCVIPASFKTDDAQRLHDVAVSAATACHTELATRSPNFPDIRLGDSARDSALVVQPRYDNKTFLNSVGSPIRSDVQVFFTSQQAATNNSRSINDSGRIVKVSQIDGFVDLVWAPVVEANNFGMYQPNVDPRTFYQKYAARFVITQVVNEYLQTLPAYLLSLVTATLVREQNNWYNAFRPRAVIPNSVDLHDIGAINLEVNLPNTEGKVLDTKEAGFDLGKLATFMSACIRPGLILSMDVEDTGPETWSTSVFAVASNGNGQAQSNAQAAIYNAANHLTSGAFQEFFQGGAMFADEGNRIHLGHYVDNNGNQRDIRDLDYVAILNLTGSQDLEIIKRYSDTFTRVDQNINQRLSDRKRILSGLVPGLEITGYATRVTFTEAFVSALTRACQKAGLQMRSDLGGLGVEAQTRTTFGGVNGALAGANPSGLFNQQAAGQIGGTSFGPTFARFGG